jgi:hypothetical protein
MTASLTFTYTDDEFVEYESSGSVWRLAFRLRKYRGPATGWLTFAVAMTFDLLGATMIAGAAIYFGIRVCGLCYLLVALMFIAIAGYLWRLIKASTAYGYRLQFAADEKLAGPFCVERTDTGIVYTTPKSRSEIEWRGLLGVDTSATSILIFDVAPRAIVIPRRVFVSTDEATAFICAITKHLQASASRLPLTESATE